MKLELQIWVSWHHFTWLCYSLLLDVVTGMSQLLVDSCNIRI